MGNVVTIDTTNHIISKNISAFYSLSEGSYCVDAYHYNADDVIDIGVKAGEFFTTGQFMDKPAQTEKSGCSSFVETESTVISSLAIMTAIFVFYKNIKKSNG